MIESLAEKRAHVPFRDSKLTYLLQDYLSIQNVYLLACVSPSALCYEESLSTLRFAEQVSNLPHRKTAMPVGVNLQMQRNLETQQ